MMPNRKELFGLLKDSALRMSDDRVPMMGAALAYYMMFSIAPLLVIAIGVAGVVFGKTAGVDVFEGMKDLVGPQGADAIGSMVRAAASRPDAGMAATLIGVVALLVGASGVFAQLQQSLNIIWKVAAKPGATWRLLLRQRLLSFGMVAVIGLLLLVSLVVSAAIAAAGRWAGGVLPGVKLLWSAVNFVVSLAIISGLFSAVLKVLPDVQLGWGDVSIGGLFTALLFVIGKAAIGAYLGRTGLSSSYGAAGSLIVVLLWVFYSSQILFFGAEFTRAWVLRLRGGRVPAPKAGAEVVMIPFAAAAAKSALEGAPKPVLEAARAEARGSWLYVGGAAAAAGALLLLRRRGKGEAALGGFALGMAAGLISLLEFPELLGDGSSAGSEEPSTSPRLVAKPGPRAV